MKHAATLELYEYWNGLRGERTSPERGEVDPAAIRGILADTFILEVDAARQFPFRLSGTRVNALFTTELKGRSFPRLWARPERSEVAALLGAVCDDAAPVVAGVRAAPRGRDPLDLELLLLPVRHLGKTHARILGCLSPAMLPSWLGLLPPEHLSLGALRMLTPFADRRKADPATPDGTRDAPWKRRETGARRGHLVVYDGGR